MKKLIQEAQRLYQEKYDSSLSGDGYSFFFVAKEGFGIAKSEEAAQAFKKSEELIEQASKVVGWQFGCLAVGFWGGLGSWICYGPKQGLAVIGISIVVFLCILWYEHYYKMQSSNVQKKWKDTIVIVSKGMIYKQ